jgi:GT2 family glycosyltransferase
MEGLSIIIPVFNKIGTTLDCIQSISEENKEGVYEIVIVDNGSTDETPAVFSKDCGAGAGLKPAPAMSDQITYIRNPENLGVSKALNIGAAAAQYNILCFMHNDVIVHEKNWTSSIEEFINSNSNAGVVGFYGAKTVREDGSFRGKSIVHSKRDNPSLSKPFETVAVVDGMLMTIKKQVFKEIGGYSDEFIVHFYDKDLSLKAITGNFVNYVLNVPFEHTCAATRSDIKDDDRVRDEAKNKFLKIWAGTLPVDVTTWREKIGYIGKGKKAD